MEPPACVALTPLGLAVVIVVALWAGGVLAVLNVIFTVRTTWNGRLMTAVERLAWATVWPVLATFLRRHFKDEDAD